MNRWLDERFGWEDSKWGFSDRYGEIPKSRISYRREVPRLYTPATTLFEMWPCPDGLYITPMDSECQNPTVASLLVLAIIAKRLKNCLFFTFSSLGFQKMRDQWTADYETFDEANVSTRAREMVVMMGSARNLEMQLSRPPCVMGEWGWEFKRQRYWCLLRRYAT